MPRAKGTEGIDDGFCPSEKRARQIARTKGIYAEAIRPVLFKIEVGSGWKRPRTDDLSESPPDQAGDTP
jgi:hypothetical protein